MRERVACELRPVSDIGFPQTPALLVAFISPGIRQSWAREPYLLRMFNLYLS